MNILNQNTILTSVEEALVPSSNLIDGRTERDWLSFIADFASLINFYDASNQLSGNWTPFLFKDPIIILASISKTNVVKKQVLFLHSCSHIESLFQKDENNTNIGKLISSLFDQIFQLFIKLEHWIRFLLKSDQEFSLKKYILYQVEHIYSGQLWALLSLRRQLILNNIMAKVENIEYSIFQNADPTIWKQSKDKKNYWEILHLNSSFFKNKISDFITAIKNSGDQLFTFFNTITQHAKVAFDKLKETRSHFPDTILMRTFIQLLMHHRNQLNGISQKHLNFYYTDILQQKIKNALPDSVFIAIALSKKDTSFLLPKGSLFDAGVDTQKEPILFSSTENITLNPATIVSAKTIAAATIENTSTKLYLENIATPSLLQKNESGKIEGWPIFGDNNPTITSSTLTLGFAFASPMLLLKEGNRTINVTLTFNEKGATTFLNNATYFLSTQKTWLSVPVSINETNDSSLSVTLSITLEASEPAIEAFIKNPDGYDSQWPMLKIQFNSISAGITIPVINTVQFDVTVQNNTTLQLYNDFGALDSKKPFELFGPTPLINSSFIIGSNEIFSKPLQSLQIDMTWDTLPKNFQTYYQEYNTYISSTITTTQKQLVPDTSKSHGILQKIENIIKAGVKLVKDVVKKAVDTIIALLKEILQLLKDILGIVDPKATTPFNNTCFTVDFEILNNATWKKIDIVKQGIAIAEDGTITPIPYTVNKYCVPPVDNSSNLLFSTDNTAQECELTPKSFFSYTALSSAFKSLASSNQNAKQTATTTEVSPVSTTEKMVTTFTANPTIQNSPLLFTAESTSGFIKMVLSGPNPYGFGSQIYPEIVGSIALQNALQISKDSKNAKKLIPSAKLPFAPKLKTIVANYSASQSYDLTKTGDFPLQCYTYAPFINYLTYDALGTVPTYNYNVGDAKIISSQASTGIPLVSSTYNYKGFLYIELKDVIAPSEINFYVELGRKEGNIPTDTKPDYYYLSTSGWQLLPLLSDGTNNLSCSGIITFNLPKNISNKTSLMNSENYWICLATKSDISNYPEITFLKTNGVLLTRSGTEYLFDTTEPKINSDSITKSHIAIPEIANIVQPFASFGGKAMENDTIKNKRVSNRLKTKDRIVSLTDYYSVIQEEFNDIYYSKSVYKNKKVSVFVVKRCKSISDYNALTPMITVCAEEKIQQYLKERTSPFTTLTVSNFSYLTVTIDTTITLSNGYEFTGVQKTVTAALKLFLSPWIVTDSPQITIGENLSADDVIYFMRTIEGVSSVDKLTFNTTKLSPNGEPIIQTDLTLIQLNQNPELIIASNINHTINERD
ncbi:hypothetical protein FIA58_004475 [Flavobacterium jejuense]|uniref:Baseplate protein J-like domain-containing protein n=1 Tax=Flavobacterium jejuense TaxID=1544455 RepID=A0ABX0IS26_9FLAO|nr:hypothetical protein [Flavobacterium jejuense]NHN24926.1 hypothetical protein [Flavobacterium jejuense]